MDRNEFSITDKDAIKDKTVCTNCNKLLNVGPIFCYEDQETSTIKEICGRCSYAMNNIHIKWRQYAFENLAQFLTYPCSHKKLGCDSILNWNEIMDHEMVCTYQSIYCPLFDRDLFPTDNCDWVGNVKNVTDHIESSHKNLILTNPQVDLNGSFQNSLFFTHVGLQLITILIKYERTIEDEPEPKCYCLLMVNGNDIESQCFRYQLELCDVNKGNSLILRRNRLEPLGCMKENMKNVEKLLEVDLSKIKEMLKCNGNIVARFGVVKKHKKEILQITGINKESEILNGPIVPTLAKEKIVSPDDNMLQELECPVCNEFMIPPIYICHAGHSICTDCESKVQNCPNCRSQLSGGRNFTLERLTAKVNYPCRNRDIGCSFVTTSDKIRSHETTCELSETTCILRCGHKCLRPAMYNHLLDKHSTLIIEPNMVYQRDVTDKKDIYYVLYVSGELFRFSIKGSGFNPYKVNMQHLGMIQGEPKFLYQLQILDPSPQGQVLGFTFTCQCLTDAPNKAHLLGVTIPWDLLKPFIFDTKYFKYQITITKL